MFKAYILLVNDFIVESIILIEAPSHTVCSNDAYDHVGHSSTASFKYSYLFGASIRLSSSLLLGDHTLLDLYNLQQSWFLVLSMILGTKTEGQSGHLAETHSCYACSGGGILTLTKNAWLSWRHAFILHLVWTNAKHSYALGTTKINEHTARLLKFKDTSELALQSQQWLWHFQLLDHHILEA